ncbi:MAG: DUF599 family protein [Pseudomonadota bacterium]|nr:MAG: DUF599 family protein [Pseudomonadota bacterium]
MFDIPIADVLGLTWFMALWVGYTQYADRYAHRTRSLRSVMHAHRLEWMQRMLTRENRMVDAGIVGSLQQSVSFFASATLLILAGLMTLLGASEKAIVLIHELSFAVQPTLLLWELKLLVLIVIFVHAFFKFTWALRQFNYCSVLIGAAPSPAAAADSDAYARRAAEVSTRASKDFNQGLRAYYLSLAALAWFVNPWAFMLATTLVIGILYWREYYSAALATLESRF